MLAPRDRRTYLSGLWSHVGVCRLSEMIDRALLCAYIERMARA